MKMKVRGMKTLRLRRGPRLFAVLPTMLTLGNAVCGFGALTFAAKVGIEKIGWGRDDIECLFISAILIFVAMVFDMLDGRAARWAKQTSQFGAELDSLCDAISFGVAPAFILIKFSPDFHPRLLWSIAEMYTLCAILRLARFNVETDDEDTHEYFSGLPSPAAAGTVASFMVAYPLLASLTGPLPETADQWDRLGSYAAGWLAPALKGFLLPMVTLACACLMVSRVRYSHVFNQLFRGRKSYQHMLLLLLGMVIAVIVRELAVPMIFCGFAFGFPVKAMIDRMRRGGGQGDQSDSNAAPPAGQPPVSGAR
jgi:CDP-diacylglycerol--serine O-phosphatidyltransferase